MSLYLKVLGVVLIMLGAAGSALCLQALNADDAYYRAALALEKYPGNVLYTTEFKMAEPRHMLLLAGAAASGPLGLILGSICAGIGALAARLDSGRS